MSHSQFHSIELFILRHAWLNLWDKRMTTGRINQVTSSPTKQLQTHCPSHKKCSHEPWTQALGWPGRLIKGWWFLRNTAGGATKHTYMRLDAPPAIPHLSHPGSARKHRNIQDAALHFFLPTSACPIHKHCYQVTKLGTGLGKGATKMLTPLTGRRSMTSKDTASHGCEHCIKMHFRTAYAYKPPISLAHLKQSTIG